MKTMDNRKRWDDETEYTILSNKKKIFDALKETYDKFDDANKNLICDQFKIKNKFSNLDEDEFLRKENTFSSIQTAISVVLTKLNPASYFASYFVSKKTNEYEVMYGNLYSLVNGKVLVVFGDAFTFPQQTYKLEKEYLDKFDDIASSPTNKKIAKLQNEIETEIDTFKNIFRDAIIHILNTSTLHFDLIDKKINLLIDDFKNQIQDIFRRKKLELLVSRNLEADLNEIEDSIQKLLGKYKDEIFIKTIADHFILLTKIQCLRESEFTSSTKLSYTELVMQAFDPETKKLNDKEFEILKNNVAFDWMHGKINPDHNSILKQVISEFEIVLKPVDLCLDCLPEILYYQASPEEINHIQVETQKLGHLKVEFEKLKFEFFEKAKTKPSQLSDISDLRKLKIECEGAANSIKEIHRTLTAFINSINNSHLDRKTIADQIFSDCQIMLVNSSTISDIEKKILLDINICRTTKITELSQGVNAENEMQRQIVLYSTQSDRLLEINLAVANSKNYTQAEVKSFQVEFNQILKLNTETYSSIQVSANQITRANKYYQDCQSVINNLNEKISAIRLIRDSILADYKALISFERLFGKSIIVPQYLVVTRRCHAELAMKYVDIETIQSEIKSILESVEKIVSNKDEKSLDDLNLAFTNLKTHNNNLQIKSNELNVASNEFIKNDFSYFKSDVGLVENLQGICQEEETKLHALYDNVVRQVDRVVKSKSLPPPKFEYHDASTPSDKYEMLNKLHEFASDPKLAVRLKVGSYDKKIIHSDYRHDYEDIYLEDIKKTCDQKYENRLAAYRKQDWSVLLPVKKSQSLPDNLKLHRGQWSAGGLGLLVGGGLGALAGFCLIPVTFGLSLPLCIVLGALAGAIAGTGVGLAIGATMDYCRTKIIYKSIKNQMRPQSTRKLQFTTSQLRKSLDISPTKPNTPPPSTNPFEYQTPAPTNPFVIPNLQPENMNIPIAEIPNGENPFKISVSV